MSSEEDRTLWKLIFSSSDRKLGRVREFLLPFLLLSSFDDDVEEKKREIKRNIAYGCLRVNHNTFPCHETPTIGYYPNDD
mmetsp:Transcript_39217/g.71829  ORF Transcript_39217/g.71829 Transcript_39217/m.71829 type:complete len:80 (+) Transcript_39217:119-358(+)